MTELFYHLAGRVIRVIAPDDQLDCNDNALSVFATQPSDWDHTLEFSIVERLSDPEGVLVFSAPTKQVFQDGDTQIRYEGTVSTSVADAYIRIARKGDHSQIQIQRRYVVDSITAKLVLNAMEAEHLIAQQNGILLHAAYIRWEDKAILFTAPSGTGKSTQADLWCRLREAELINGDRAAIMVTTDGIEVRGIPFAGSSGVCKNVSLPLAAIVYLAQAPSTSIKPLTGVQAFRHLWEGCSVNVWNREDMDLSSRAVADIVDKIPVFYLACTPDESAVIALEKALAKQ